MSAIDTTYLRASKEAIASPTDYSQSPLSHALWQSVLLVVCQGNFAKLNARI
ncbi:MAG: hypothetical protein V7K89_01580 [Nostoc sp.]|uniref:hypothetical protein n=1 Tax=Nostoc sp. TaxID=1180 RepID=UPI002FF4B95A